MANILDNSLETLTVSTEKILVAKVGGTTKTVLSASVANTHGSSTIAVSVYIKRSGTSYYLIKEHQLAPTNALIVIGEHQKVVLKDTDDLCVVFTGGGTADATASFLSQT